ETLGVFGVLDAALDLEQVPVQVEQPDAVTDQDASPMVTLDGTGLSHNAPRSQRPRGTWGAAAARVRPARGASVLANSEQPSYRAARRCSSELKGNAVRKLRLSPQL